MYKSISLVLVDLNYNEPNYTITPTKHALEMIATVMDYTNFSICDKHFLQEDAGNYTEEGFRLFYYGERAGTVT